MSFLKGFQFKSYNTAKNKDQKKRIYAFDQRK